MTATSIEQFRFEPTVFGADVTVPRQLSVADKGTSQYLDNQTLLLQSQEVAQRAVRIANVALGSNRLAARDFSGDNKSLKITRPERAAPGTYRASIITGPFTWSDARIAQVAANAILQAFDETRSAAISAQGNATLAAITKAVADGRSQDQRSRLLNQRTQVLVNQQIDFVHHPPVAWTTEHPVPFNDNLKNAGALGLLIGTMLGAALVFARASSRSGFDNRLHPRALYGVTVSSIDPLARRAWMPHSRPPACPGRVVSAAAIVVNSPFGSPRRQHRGPA